MKSVWIIMEHDWEYDEIEGVFISEEKAKEYVDKKKKQNRWDIEKWDVEE